MQYGLQMFRKLLQLFSYLFRQGNSKFHWLVLMYPVFFPTIKSWGNTIAFLMLAVALSQISLKKKLYFKERSKTFWLLLLTLISPFCFELIVQCFRGPFTWNALDGPSRFLIGGIIFIFLSRKDKIGNLVKSFSLGCTIGLFFTFIYTLYFDSYDYWLGRCATEILCPNALPVFILIMGINSFFYIYFADLVVPKKNIVLLLISIIVVYILVICETRTVWVSLILSVVLSCILLNWKKKVKLLFLFLVLVLFSSSSYIISPTIKKRVDYTYQNISKLFREKDNPSTWNSSLGGRLGLLKLDVNLASQNIFGFPDGVLPSYERISERIPFMTEHVYNIRLLSGSHCEYTAHLSRKGIILGMLTIVSIFIFPLYFFCRILKTAIQDKIYSYPALITITSILVNALGIQVFGLKMTSTFWAVYLALFYSYGIRSIRNRR